ncbi:flagellar basal body P-ring protein FlgI [Chromobacterium alticapitis]|uniref:Flagellar P-ring protein n=1 Tax=Chromobacterium alticapitis TaxID=2073169 RepID=A0A2S5DF81_9NEIS|nr:flagellar basal body P-ring protein FlgI [Chromobacterium alticapitis]POZ61632.1 flagellar biosynthesis protein FlgI [Chromobacterium alticapitis]
MESRILKRLCAAAMLAALSFAAAAQPLRQLVNVEGIRDNQLIGYGIVVGLDGTGDNSQVKFSGQSVANMLKQFGLKMPEKTDTRVKNVAAVMVSASLPPGYSRGQTIDVTVSSLGDAKSLRGGTLLLTQLKAANGEVYALAQGNVVIGGLSAQGKSGSSVTVNTPTAGRIPNGASIEREIPSDFEQGDSVRLSLRRPSFETATNVVKAINRSYGKIAGTRNATTIEVKAPLDPTERVAFVARLEKLNVDTGPDIPRVVFNSRTGTVVISEGVTVRAAAVSHGSLRVVISETSQVSQPGPFSNGTTQVVPNSNVDVQQGKGQMFKWPAGASLRAIIDAVNRTGATPDDVMAILQALDQAGAIDGELIVI